VRDAFIQTIKTMVQSMVKKAGFDKTRTAQIVGVNTITNTYSVKVDGQTYNNVKTVNDATYSIHDIVKLVIPCNQATQMYIESSVISDSSLGKKVGQAEAIGEQNQQDINEFRTTIDQMEIKVDALGNVYQLYIYTTYTSTSIIYNAKLYINAVDVTDKTTDVSGAGTPMYSNDMTWVIKEPSGDIFLGYGSVYVLNKSDVHYGKTVRLNWVLRDFMYLLDEDGDNLITNDGDKIIGRSESDDVHSTQ
jgi:hypothetical protein